MFSKSTWISVFTLMMIFGLVLSACVAPPPPVAEEEAGTEATGATEQAVAAPAAEGPQPGGTLTLAIRQEPSSLDPGGSANAVSQRALANLYDSLVWMTPEGEFVPWLATSWTVSDDGMAYTFKLREDVKFHDGTPFTAEAVQVTLDRILDPETGSTSAKTAIGPYDHTEIVDDHTVVIHTKDPYGPFLYALSQPFLGIVSPAAVEEYGNADFLRHPVGTGPFMFEEMIPQDHITLVRNPDYRWPPEGIFDNPGPAYLEKIVIRTVPEASTRLATLLNGEANLIEPVPAQDLQALEDDPAYYVLKKMYPGEGRFAFLNTKKFPTDDVQVRRAILHAVDNVALERLLFFGAHEPGRSPLSTASVGYNAKYETMYGYDPDKASAILDEAGWAVGDDGIRVKDGEPLVLSFYVIAQNPDTEKMSEFIQGQLREVGVDAQLTTVARAAWYEGLNKGDHNIVVLFLIYGDPDVLRLTYHSEFIPFNWSHWTDPETDRILEEAYQATDFAKRIELYEQVQDTVMDQALVLTLFYENNLLGASQALQGIMFDITAYPLFYGAHITE